MRFGRVSQKHHDSRWQFALALMLLVTASGVAGYVFLANLDLVSAVYMTLITLTTTGFSDIAEESSGDSRAVMLFTTLLMIFGIATLAYAFSIFMRSMVEGELRDVIGLRRTRRRVYRMKNHYIVCGYGRMGEIIAEALVKERIPVVVIESDPDLRVSLEEQDVTFLMGDATQDDILKEAGVERAHALLAVTHTDPANLFITLSARQLNPNLLIVTRALSSEAESKLLRAGANRVILPYKLGAHQIAQAALRPNVVDFIEIATRTTQLDIEIEEIPLPASSELTGKALKEATLLRSLGLIVIGVRQHSDDRMCFNPSADTIVEANDILIVLGKPESLAKFRQATS